tara:strand:+ start:225 stop:587 length:363 start_codon:yes stop_codon:yes gene_type:complete
MQKIYKSGTNRGNRRVWIEGAALLDHQWTRGTPFSANLPEPDQYGKALVLVAQRFKRPADSGGVIWHERWHKVSGTDKRPIIDLNGAYLNDLFGGCTHFKATISRDWIAIKPCNEEGLAQ